MRTQGLLHQAQEQDSVQMRRVRKITLNLMKYCLAVKKDNGFEALLAYQHLQNGS